jgi:hypothetical protein
MKYVIVVFVMFYFVMVIAIFVMHTQMPVTFWLAVLRSVFWPIWVAGGLKGRPLPMDQWD